MAKRSEPPLIELLSDSEFGELDDLLLSENLSEERMNAVTFEGKTYTIVDEWCSGFLLGIGLASDAWQPLLDEKPGMLRPFQLFATPEGWAELDAAEDEAAMHAEWSGKIEPMIKSIHAYCLPSRAGSGKTLA